MINSVLDGEKDTNIISYPKLMIATNEYIVLMVEERCGTVVYNPDGSGQEVAHYSSRWDMDIFKDYNGIVTLSNK